MESRDRRRHSLPTRVLRALACVLAFAGCGVAEKAPETAAGGRPAALVHGLEPPGRQYAQLKAARAHYAAIVASGGWPAVEATGDSAGLVRSLRARLIAEQDPQESPLAERGAGRAHVFDADLRTALEGFQQRHGLAVTGELDEATLAALNVSARARVATLGLNLERWRDITRDPAPLHVLVNVPAFEVFIIENDRSLMRMRAVVGAEQHPTPVLEDTMMYLVTNPFWNVPRSIVAEEILPALAQNPDYLAAKNMELIDPAADNAPVDPSTIDWKAVDADSFHLSIRQRPGPGNALGAVKFMFPNQRAIYLHDTPEVSLFENTDRAHSHGCIRIEEPLELARLLLERRTDRGAGALDALLADPAEQWVRLDHGIPVFVLYLTAWAEEDGRVRFLPDVYGHDESAERSLSDPGTLRPGRVADSGRTRP